MRIPFRGLFGSTRAESDEADVAREVQRGGRSRAEVGVIGIVVCALLVVSAMQMDRLPFLSPISTYSTWFDDAGGLMPGDTVVVSGVEVGTVSAISLAPTDAGTKAKVDFRMADTVVMGVDTRASIKTETVLGRRNLTVMPLGTGRIKPGESIPYANTVAPYSLADALEGATDTLAATDTDALNEALTTLTETFSDTPGQVQGAVEGVSRLSEQIADRDNALRELLGRADAVAEIVGQRSDQINQLLVDANALLGELQLRRTAIGELITGTEAVSAQISGFIADNNEQLKPVLTKLSGVLDILNDNRADLETAIDGLGPYANLLGEAVASGPYFSSLVGLPSTGDYTLLFAKILQEKYPQVADVFARSGNPVYPDAWSIERRTRPPAEPIPDTLPGYPTPPPTNGGR